MIKTWDELTHEEMDVKLLRSEADIAAGRVFSQDELDSKMMSVFIEKGKELDSQQSAIK